MSDPEYCPEGGIHDPSTQCSTCGSIRALQAVTPSRSLNSSEEQIIREDEISMVISHIDRLILLCDEKHQDDSLQVLRRILSSGRHRGTR